MVTSDKPIRKFAYPIPNKILQQTKDEVSKLMQLGASPHEMCQGYSIFDPERKRLNNLLKEVNLRRRKQQKVNLLRINKGRIKYEYSKGDTVYRFVKQKSKLDPAWDGPFTIQSIDNEGNTNTISNSTLITKVNLKQIRTLL